MKKTKKMHVKVKPWKLQDLALDKYGGGSGGSDEAEKLVMAVEVKWKGPKSGLVPFYRPWKTQFRNVTGRRRCLRRGEYVEWDDEFKNVCCFSGPWSLSFYVLCGESTECDKAKLEVIGKGSLDLGEVLASKVESTVERKLPIRLKGYGIDKEASLVVSVGFAESRTPPDSAGSGQISSGSGVHPETAKSLRGSKKNEPSDRASSRPGSFDWSETERSRSPGTESSSTEQSSGTELGTSSSPETRPESGNRSGFFSWKKRRLSFSRSRRRGQFVQRSNGQNDDVATSGDLKKGDEMDLIEADDWVVKELVSRDGKTVLKSSVFFASFDQRSEKAAGESACTVLVAVVAHWLHSHPNLTPLRSEFDSLITQGSSVWQSLCADESHVNAFPDKHFDLETVLGANVKPLTVSTNKSFTGFFHPEKFDSLKGLMSFDQIWDEINAASRNEDIETRVYIVSWNDHFFVMKVKHDECYIIDSLGERLSEGCKQAYVLKFDAMSSIHLKAKNEEGGESEELVARGKECCREYMKRFLAVIVAEELEAEEKKGKVSVMELHQRLQIDFHYTSLCVLDQ